MTDKQIIIDGVDVSGCLFYQTNFEEDYDVKIKHYCSNWHNSCESNNNSNCYYKQLQREKQNSQEAIDISIKEFNRAEELKTLLKRKEQECEELKHKIELMMDCAKGQAEQKLERITNILFTGQCSNCEGYSPNCSNKELCDFKHNIKNIIDEVEQ